MFKRGFITGAVCTGGFIGLYTYFLNIETEEEYQKKKRLASIFKYGLPQKAPDVMCYSNHALNYDQAKKIPSWVAEYIVKDNLEGSTDRKDCHFKPDPNIDPSFSASNNDYWKSGWSRGHMAPAGDIKHCLKAMQETFYLSNIVPQDIDNNAGFWNRVEIYCRELTKTFKHIRVISGPLLMPTVDANGKKNVNYQVIGESGVVVPTHLYKVVIAEDDKNFWKAVGAFIIPNKPIPSSHQLKEYEVPLEILEKQVGLKFLPKLNQKDIVNLCQIEGCQLIPQEKLDIIFTTRKLETATTLHRVETVWKELEKKNIKPDPSLINLYNCKREEMKIKEMQKTVAA